MRALISAAEAARKPPPNNDMQLTARIIVPPAWRAKTMTANVRAITIRQPYAWAIVKKGKRIENRTWSTKSRGDLFIHAGVGYGDEQWLQDVQAG